MQTINSYNSDSSFEGRVQAWRTSFNIAKERITGGGFSSVNLDWVAQAYRSPGSLPAGKAAHSIYFEVLGDHGYLGLLIFLLLLAAAWYNTIVHSFLHPRQARSGLGFHACANDAGQHCRLRGRRGGAVDGLL